MMAPAICPALNSSAVLTSRIIKFGLFIFCCVKLWASGASMVGADAAVVIEVNGVVGVGFV